MSKKPTHAELKRIHTIAHKCYGYDLSPNRVIDICRLINGETVHEQDVPKHIMRAIANMHIQLLPYWGQNGKPV